MGPAEVIAIAAGIVSAMAVAVQYLFARIEKQYGAQIATLEAARAQVETERDRERARADASFDALVAGQERMRTQSTEMVEKFVTAMSSDRLRASEWERVLERVVSQLDAFAAELDRVSKKEAP